MFRRRITRLMRRPTKSPHVRYNPKPLTHGQKIYIVFLIVILLLLAALSLTLIRVRPMVMLLAKSQAVDVITKQINDVVNDEISAGELDYSKLITLDKDGNGNITALETNMASINELQAKISSRVAGNVQNTVNTDMNIPIGNAFGGILFSGRGPSIPVRIQSITNVHTKFTNSFASAGINQTRHKIMIQISVDINVLVPGDSESTNVTTEMEVAETVIVGQVPNVYADMGGG